MTRLAILEPDPRICGAVTWSLHVAEGARTFGWDVEIVTPTKSGKPSTRWGVDRPRPDHGAGWSAWLPTATPKWHDAIAYLRQFDLIILPEPKSAHLDKAAVKAKTRPEYLNWLDKAGVPWMTALMGPQYDPKKWAPLLDEALLNTANRVPAIATSSQRFCDTHPTLAELRDSGRCKFPVHALPYAVKRSVVSSPRARTGTVGFTGRMMPNLGPQLLAVAAIQSPFHYCELWGSASIGQGVNPTYILWRHLSEQSGHSGRRLAADLMCTQCKKDWKGTWLPPHGIACDCGYQLTAPIRPHPWEVTTGSHVIRYCGPYTDEIETCERFDVHVDLTGVSYTYDLEKYTTLEAIDAGCIPIVPPHLDVNGFWVLPARFVDDPVSLTRIERGDPKAEGQLGGVGACLSAAAALSDADRESVIAYNRRRLREVNDPASFLRTWLEAANP